MVSEARDEMKQAFINTQSNAISTCDLARRPVLLRVHASDTPVKRELRSNVRDTRRDGSKRSGGEQTNTRGQTKESNKLDQLWYKRPR